MKYVDGYVLPIPKKNLAAYRRMAKKASTIWRDHGALQYVESVGEDMQTPMGTTFPRTLKLGRGETVVFAWVVFKSRKHRDAVNSAVMRDPRLAGMMDMKSMPFDPKRMIYGGFDFLVEAGPKARRGKGRAATRR